MYEDPTNSVYVRQHTSTRLIERKLVNQGDQLLSQYRGGNRVGRLNENIADDYQIMYDTFGKPIGALQQGQQAPGANSDDAGKKNAQANRLSTAAVATNLRFSDQVDEFLNLNEPVGETGVVTVLNQKIIEDDDDYHRRQRENLI